MEQTEEKGNCYCEDPKCSYYPLNHFEECPRCESKAYHLPKFPFTGVQE